MARSSTPRSPTIALIGTRAPQLQGLPCVQAYGEADDHLRLSVLLADRLPGDEQAARACKEPHLPWEKRRERLKVFLGTLRPSGSGFIAGIVDLDALHPGKYDAEASWDDSEFYRERLDTYHLLLEAARQGGWVLLRPAPRPDRAQDVAEFPSELAEPPAVPRGRAASATLLSGLSPVLRPVLQWLLADKVVDERHALRLIRSATESGDEASLAVLELAYDHLRPSLREVAKRLSVLRPAQSFNGHLGPYALGEEDLSRHGVPRAAVEALVRAGLLQPGLAPSTLVMPTAIRLFLRTRAEVSLGIALEQEHRWLASQGESLEETEQWAEVHYHAVQGGDLEQAERTARYYGSDLRALAVRWSREGRFTEAASVFERIVLRFDSQDAYAWEYLGYNLARAYVRPPAEVQEQIRRAYERAFQLAPNNPLYHGRLLGWRARRGEDIRQEVLQSLPRYRATMPAAALSYFGEPVLKGLLMGGARHKRLAEDLRQQWPELRQMGSNLGIEEATLFKTLRALHEPFSASC